MDRLHAENKILETIESNHHLPITALLDSVAAALKDNFSHYTGVYIYLLDGDTLVLGPYRGRATEHVRIPVGMGICGRAARTKEIVTVDDVTQDTEYISCSIQTRSEIVVPIMNGERVLGEIDIDSDLPAAFTNADEIFLKEVAERLQRAWEQSPSKRA